jgi:RNA-directed DNA polymerase
MNQSYAEDDNHVMKSLPKWFGKYSLRLHPEKTRILNLNQSDKGNRNFNFLVSHIIWVEAGMGSLSLNVKRAKRNLAIPSIKWEIGLNETGIIYSKKSHTR